MTQFWDPRLAVAWAAVDPAWQPNGDAPVYPSLTSTMPATRPLTGYDRSRGGGARADPPICTLVVVGGRGRVSVQMDCYEPTEDRGRMQAAESPGVPGIPVLRTRSPASWPWAWLEPVQE